MAILFFKNHFYPKAKIGDTFSDEFNFNQEKGVAFQNGDAFFALSLNNGGNPHFYQVPAGATITLKEWVLKSFGDSAPIESNYSPGTFYKRMWRPGGVRDTADEEKRTQSFVALKILLDKLEELFETVEPNNANSLTFGHKIREIILLACMEVESSWAAVLKENAYSNSGRFTTNDYVKLSTPMFLDGYELCLQQYPNYPSFIPFNGWDVTRPTASLVWYDAYNKTKHDRETNLNLATLDNAIWSVGAVVVMFYAQYGMKFGLTGSDPISPFIGKVFRIKKLDITKYEKEYYVPKLVLPLGSAFPQWTALNFPFI